MVTEESYFGQEQGSDHRTRAWALPHGRVLPTTVDTGLVGITSAHTPLLEERRSMQQDHRHPASQALPAERRPLHLLRDQEVLLAPQGSRGFAPVSIVALHRVWTSLDVTGRPGSPSSSVCGDCSAGRVRRRRCTDGAETLGGHHSNSFDGRFAGTSSAYGVRAAARGAVAADRGGAPNRSRPLVDAGLPDGRVAPGSCSATPAWPTTVVPELPVALVDSTVRRARRRLQLGRYAR